MPTSALNYLLLGYLGQITSALWFNERESNDEVMVSSFLNKAYWIIESATQKSFHSETANFSRLWKYTPIHEGDWRTVNNILYPVCKTFEFVWGERFCLKILFLHSAAYFYHCCCRLYYLYCEFTYLTLSYWSIHHFWITFCQTNPPTLEREH